MIELTLDEMAKELYDDCQTVKPSWDQLGEVTKKVWRERAKDGVTPECREPINKGRMTSG